MQSQVNHNFHPESEVNINKLVNIKLTASYTYLSLGMYFDRDDVALRSFSSFFLERSVKEREQAEKLLEYQNMRGGRVLLQPIAKPSREDWRGGLDAITFSLEFQKTLNTSLLEVHRGANTHTDPHLCDFLEQHFLSDSHDTIKKLGDHLGSLTRLTSSETHGSMGEYLFDKHTL
ncbi:ferritin, lower subunit isoform X1 [Salvelinus namaycush]|uniref:Ferritin n=3 Tax=Salmoninae TaxID=504568 RepID=A0A8U0QQ56_SALNM|nr:ferritin, lower subunit-like isoform X2 [Oncorhynchus keta]XP_038847290.1 ferritin, lower subunit isoform X1 [Salvelinus namaycush]